ncbi:MAG: type II secretion system protein [Phycisphaerae bacterium]
MSSITKHRTVHPTAVGGFTLIELLVVISIIGLLATLIIPSLGGALEMSRRATCAANLREIAKGCKAYALENRYHRGTISKALPSNGPTSNNWGDMEDGNPGSLWLLIEHKFASGVVMMCPAAKRSREGFRTASVEDGSFEKGTLAYSYLSQVPFRDSNDNRTWEQTPITQDEVGALVIAADLNPICEQGTESIDNSEKGKNSRNHGREGQNVARLSEVVEWVTTTEVNGDDIYTSQGSESDGERDHLSDAFLIP